MSTPYLGEIRMTAFDFPPRTWALCNGQILSIQQNAALFSLLGTTYGGNGVTTFALPNLQGRAPIHSGQGPGLDTITLGQSAGQESHTLTIQEIPQHNHLVAVSDTVPNSSTPTNQVLAQMTAPGYAAPPPNSTMHPASLGAKGGNQPHNNMQPYLVVSYAISLQGIYPSAT